MSFQILNPVADQIIPSGGGKNILLDSPPRKVRFYGMKLYYSFGSRVHKCLGNFLLQDSRMNFTIWPFCQWISYAILKLNGIQGVNY